MRECSCTLSGQRQHRKLLPTHIPERSIAQPGIKAEEGTGNAFVGVCVYEIE